MAYYRIFIFNRKNHFADIDLVDCDTDDEALVLAAKRVTDHLGAEVWDCARIVGTLLPREQPQVSIASPNDGDVSGNPGSLTPS